jgi:hypothetical protein
MDAENDQRLRIPEKNKVPGLPYVFTDTGLELAVLDITHPLFETSIDPSSLAEQRTRSSATAALIKTLSADQCLMDGFQAVRTAGTAPVRSIRYE